LTKKHKETISLPPEHEYQLKPVGIVADGAIAGAETALGRLVPVIIIDSTDRPDIDELMRAHDELQAIGDVVARWAKPKVIKQGPGYLTHLVLHFIRPIDSLVVIRFETAQAGLVDQIVRMKLVYIQAGRPGDRLSGTLDGTRIAAEIRDADFERSWDAMLLESTIAEFRSRGLTKKQSKSAAREAVSRLRKLGDIRMSPRKSRDPDA
jgi:hypothetical protein